MSNSVIRKTFIQQRMRTLIAAISLLCATPLMAATAPTPVVRDLKDWTVTCDNTRHCTAISDVDSDRGSDPALSLDDGDPDARNLVVRLDRDAGPDARASLFFYADKAISSSKMQLDGRALDLGTGTWKIQKTGDGGGAYSYSLSTHDNSSIETWIAAVRNGKAFRFGTAKDRITSVVSLDGLSAALLLIDDVQGRVGTVTALIKRGDVPASAVPAAPTLPVSAAQPKAPIGLSAAERRQLIAATLAQNKAAFDGGNCEEDSGLLRDIDEAEPLTDKEALVALGCSRGAYNFNTLWFRVERQAPHRTVPLTLDVKSEPPTSEASLVNANYDPASGRLSYFEKARGVGDCGDSATWQFDGRQFQLIERRFMGHCYGLGSDEWPYLYRSRM